MNKLTKTNFTVTHMFFIAQSSKKWMNMHTVLSSQKMVKQALHNQNAAITLLPLLKPGISQKTFPFFLKHPVKEYRN